MTSEFVHKKKKKVREKVVTLSFLTREAPLFEDGGKSTRLLFPIVV